MYINVLSTDLHVLSVDMAFAVKSLNEVTNYVKKLEGVGKVRLPKVLAKNYKTMGSFNGSYSKGPSQQIYLAPLIQLVVLASAGGHSGVPKQSQALSC